MRACLSILIVVTWAFGFTSGQTVYAQEDDGGKIEAFEDAIEEKEEKEDRRGHHGTHNDTPEEWEIILYALEAMPELAEGFGGLVFGVWPKYSRYYNPDFWHSRFASYPYHTPDHGLYSGTRGVGASIATAGHYFYHSSALNGYSVRSHIAPSPLMGFEFHVTGLTESLARGNDLLAFYDVFLNYYRVRQERVALWWGIGMKSVQGDATYRGPAFNIGMQIYPGRPLSLHLAWNTGALNTNAVYETLARLNVHIYRSVWFIGYQRFSVRSSAIDGFISGMGFYF